MKYDHIESTVVGFSYYLDQSDREYYSVELTETKLHLMFTNSVVWEDGILAELRKNKTSFVLYEKSGARHYINTYALAKFEYVDVRHLNIGYIHRYYVSYHLCKPSIRLFEDQT